MKRRSTAVLVAALAAGCSRSEERSTATTTAAATNAPDASSSVHRGVLRHVADATTFQDCVTGVTWPVAPEGAARLAEREALEAGGGLVVVEVLGRVAERPEPDHVDGRARMLVIDRLVSSSRDVSACAVAAASSMRLAGTQWDLVELDGKAPSGTSRVPHLYLADDGRRVRGYGGCNNLSGTWATDVVGPAGGLRFDDVANTRRACPGGAVEPDLLRALAATRRFEIAGRTLTLFDGDGPRARFAASPR